jgi:hypothetical protein
MVTGRWSGCSEGDDSIILDVITACLMEERREGQYPPATSVPRPIYEVRRGEGEGKEGGGERRMLPLATSCQGRSKNVGREEGEKEEGGRKERGEEEGIEEDAASCICAEADRGVKGRERRKEEGGEANLGVVLSFHSSHVETTIS